jgi:hypothetical protein
MYVGEQRGEARCEVVEIAVRQDAYSFLDRLWQI